MTFLVALLLVTASFAKIYGWTAIELTDNSTEHAGHCYSQNEDVGILKDGEEKQLKDICVKVVCGWREGLGGEVNYYGCGTLSAGPPCKVVDGDLSKPYPECCPMAEC